MIVFSFLKCTWNFNKREQNSPVIVCLLDYSHSSDFTFTFHLHALEKEMATHSSVLAWRIPGMGEPGGLPSVGSHRVGHDWSDLAAAAAVGIKCCLTVLLIFIPLVTNDVEYLFVCAYCLFVYFLWRNVCSYPLFIFHLSYLSLLFWILAPYHMYHAVLSHFSQLYTTLWAIACQVPLSVGFSQQEYWSGLLCPPPGDLPKLGIKPVSLMSPALVGEFFTTSTTWEAPLIIYIWFQIFSPVLWSWFLLSIFFFFGHPSQLVG